MKYLLIIITIFSLLSCVKVEETPQLEETSVISDSSAKTGMKTKIIHPINGLTILYYEGHKYISKGWDSSWVHAEDCKEKDERSNN